MCVFPQAKFGFIMQDHDSSKMFILPTPEPCDRAVGHVGEKAVRRFTPSGESSEKEHVDDPHGKLPNMTEDSGLAFCIGIIVNGSIHIANLPLPALCLGQASKDPQGSHVNLHDVCLGGPPSVRNPQSNAAVAKNQVRLYIIWT